MTVQGDITQATENVIVHVVNCQGVMGSGVAAALKERFPGLFSAYRQHWEEHGKENALGTCCLYHHVEPDGRIITIANLFAQKYYGYDGKRYMSYDALLTALEDMKQQAETWYSEHGGNGNMVTYALPYLMGSHRAGGNWDIVMAMVKSVIGMNNTTIYRLN